MATREKSKKRKHQGVVAETLEITGRSVKATGRRTAALAIAAIVILGLTYLAVKDGRTTVSATVSGNNGTAIGQARDVTVNNGSKEAK
jgi:ferric-dicitrate binding protein FerR (iron transport regulator)